MFKSLPARENHVSHRFFLRRETETEHRSVELAMSPHDPSSPAGYRRFLQAQWRAIAPCEAAIDEADVLIDDWNERRRCPALLRDLELLGLSAELPQVARPRPNSPIEALGLLYVLEGSRLGGQLLARQLEGNPSARCRRARHFLDHGREARLWHRFVTILDSTTLDDGGREELLRGAKAGFACFNEAAAITKDYFPHRKVAA